MLKNRYAILTYSISAIFAGLIMFYAFQQRKTQSQKQEIQSFIKLNFSKTENNPSTNLFSDSVALYSQITKQFIEACPDSIVLKMFFKNDQKKTKGLSHFFSFVFTSLNTLAVSSIYIFDDKNLINAQISFSCSGKFPLTISFLKQNEHLKIFKIYGLKEFGQFLCPIFKK